MCCQTTRVVLFVFISQCWVHHLSVFFVFFVTLTCFPAIQAGVEPSGSPGFVISRKFTEYTWNGILIIIKMFHFRQTSVYSVKMLKYIYIYNYIVLKKNIK